MKIDTTPSDDKIDTLLAEWKKDAVLNILEPDIELRKISPLHAKYLTILSSHRRALKEGERRLTKLKRLKYEYYTGRLDKVTLDKYEWPPFPYTLKGDLNTYLDSDKELLNARAVLSIHEEVVDLTERILKELGSRTFQLKDIISWARFTSGV